VAVSGWEFGADLSELKKVGSVDLPSMSYTFASLNSMVNGTEGSDKNAFDWVNGASSQAYQPWAELRDSLQNFLGKTAQNLEAAASAIDQIVQTYAASDAGAASALNSAWSGGPPNLEPDENPPPPTAPPAVVLK
jgi:hypothetical protein